MKIIWLNFEDTWMILKDKKIYRGTFKETIRFLYSLGAEYKEMEFMVTQMEEKRHNFAELGVLRCGYIFSGYDPKYDIYSKIVA